MTVILVVATLIVLLTVDWLQSRRLEHKVLVTERILPATAEAGLERLSGGFLLPAQLRYHPAHTWAHRESESYARVGLDDFAAKLIGHADRIQLPKFGQWVRQGERLGSVWRDGRKVDFISPVEGIVTDVNMGVVEDPGLALKAPYDEGWLLGVQVPDLKTAFRNLLSGSLARQWMEEAADRLRRSLAPPAGATAQDGGTARTDMDREIEPELWGKLVTEFLQNSPGR